MNSVGTWLPVKNISRSLTIFFGQKLFCQLSFIQFNGSPLSSLPRRSLTEKDDGADWEQKMVGQSFVDLLNCRVGFDKS